MTANPRRPARLSPRTGHGRRPDDSIVNRGSALGCYHFEPEGNRTEVFWLTGRSCWVPVAEPIDIERPDEVIRAEVDRLWQRIGHVPPGGMMHEESAPSLSGVL